MTDIELKNLRKIITSKINRIKKSNEVNPITLDDAIGKMIEYLDNIRNDETAMENLKLDNCNKVKTKEDIKKEILDYNESFDFEEYKEKNNVNISGYAEDLIRYYSNDNLIQINNFIKYYTVLHQPGITKLKPYVRINYGKMCADSILKKKYIYDETDAINMPFNEISKSMKLSKNFIDKCSIFERVEVEDENGKKHFINKITSTRLNELYLLENPTMNSSLIRRYSDVIDWETVSAQADFDECNLNNIGIYLNLKLIYNNPTLTMKTLYDIISARGMDFTTYLINEKYTLLKKIVGSMCDTINDKVNWKLFFANVSTKKANLFKQYRIF